jgi:hypothetical protein
MQAKLERQNYDATIVDHERSQPEEAWSNKHDVHTRQKFQVEWISVGLFEKAKLKLMSVKNI